MRRSQSMENLPMLPEEAKMAASLLRLTLSDQQETSTESEFQSYMCKHNHFPYHKSVPIAIVHANSEAIPIRRIVAKAVSPNQPRTQRPGGKPVVRRRFESSPCALTSDETKIIDSAAARLSQSVPTETQGFFQRLFPSFMRRRTSSEKQSDTASPVVVKSQPAPTRINKTLKSSETLESGHFVCQVTRRSQRNNMDNFIFMSMR